MAGGRAGAAVVAAGVAVAAAMAGSGKTVDATVAAVTHPATAAFACETLGRFAHWNRDN